MKVKVEDLQCWGSNPREIDETQFDALKKYITKWGLLSSLLVDAQDGITVLGGNMRLRALKELGIEEAEVTMVNVRNDEERLEVALLDNNQFGHYVRDQLVELTINSDIDLQDFKIDLNPVPLPDLFPQTEPDVTEDDFDPDSVEKNIHGVVEGDIWLLGEHRLMCGDSTSIDAVEELMDGAKADMVFTDPPYNTGMTAQIQAGQGDTLWEGNKQKGEKARLSHMFNDSYTDEEWSQFLVDVFNNYVVSTKGEAAMYVCIDWRRVADIKAAMENVMDVTNVIVWDKVVHGLGSDYKYTYELIVVGKKGKPEINNRFGEDYRDVWHVQRKVGRNKDHATAKPIELCVKPIKHASKQDDIVLDLFGGSGSTLIACEQLNRKCYMMEIDPHYCSVIIERWQKLTNQEAKRLGDPV
jgi:DNA modification methylase